MVLFRAEELNYYLPSITQGPSVLDTSAIQATQQERQHRLQQVCASMGFPRNDTSPLDLSFKRFHRIYVFPKYKLLYCAIPKVGITSWKILFLYLHGHIEGQHGSLRPKSPKGNSMANRIFPRLSRMQPEAARKALQEYTSFVFVRNPYTRLLSAYNNKFAHRPLTSMYAKMVRNWSLENRPGFKPPPGGEIKVSFDEFIRHYIGTKRKDIHWEDMFELCHPCHVHYNFIGFYETLATDSDYILNLVGVPPDIRLASSDVAGRQTNSSNMDTLKASYSQLSDKLFTNFSKSPGLLRDCELFDYRMPECLKRD